MSVFRYRMLAGNRAVWLGLIAALALIVQAPLIFNPGYLSSDELQWWARASVDTLSELPFVAWTDLSVFQFRPLTFVTWLLLAHLFAAHAFAMHAVFVLLGTLNALLLAVCLRAIGVARPTAAIAALIFICTPYVAYTHGWTGTLADLLVLQFGLLGFGALRLASVGAPRYATMLAWLGVPILAVLALTAKESAVVLPMLWLAAACNHAARRRVFGIVAVASAIVLVYLGLRLSTILLTPVAPEGYAWRLANIPSRLAGYALYPWLPPLFEVGPSLEKSPTRLLFAALCCTALLYALWQTSWRHAALGILLFVGLLAPVLVLEHSFNQYAYLASAAAIGVAAHAWQTSLKPARGLMLAVCAVACTHGVQVMLRMRDVGIIEQRFHAQLIDRLMYETHTLTITTAQPSDAWMLERFVRNVPSYRGVPLAGRVDIDTALADARALTMQPDGSLTSATAQLSPAR